MLHVSGLKSVEDLLIISFDHLLSERYGLMILSNLIKAPYVTHYIDRTGIEKLRIEISVMSTSFYFLIFHV